MNSSGVPAGLKPLGLCRMLRKVLKSTVGQSERLRQFEQERGRGKMWFGISFSSFRAPLSGVSAEARSRDLMKRR